MEKIRIEDGFYTSKQMQEMFRIAPITLQRWRKTGKIPFVHITAKTLLYPKAEIDRFIEEHTQRREKFN